MTNPMMVSLRSAAAACAVFIALPASAQFPPAAPAYRLIQSSYKPGEMFVAAYSVTDFGAKGDAATDDTGSFQRALDAAKAIGGGTVYVPAGRYAIKGTLAIGTNVALRGQWRSPEDGKPAAGTILMAYAGRGQDGEPRRKAAAGNSVPGFLILANSSSVRDLSIWYPEQRADAVVAYAPAILLTGSYASVQDMSLVNAYRGVQCAIDSGEACYYVRNLIGTPLSLGVEIDAVADIGRLEHIALSPKFWASSGLPGAPSADGPQASFCARRGTGIVMRRNDWSYADGVDIEGYSVGFRTAHTRWPEGGYPNGYCDDIRLAHCGIGLSYDDGGVGFSRLKTLDCQTGIYCSSRFGGTLKLVDGAISGRANSLVSRGRGTILVQHSRFTGGPVVLASGAASIVDCRLGGPAPQVSILQADGSASLLGDAGDQPLKIVAPAGAVVKVSAAPRPSSLLPACSPADESAYHAARAALFPVTGAPASDATDAIQATLAQAGAAGGGIVYLPPGEYTLRRMLTVPPGVELRGSSDAMHDTIRPGSILFVYGGRGSESGDPAIRLAPHSGLRGVTIGYPEQHMDKLAAYPPAIQLAGPDCYVMDVGAVNPWSLVDAATNRCDRHYIARVTGAAIRHGFTVGGHSVGGRIEDCQQNSGAIMYGQESWRGGWAFCPPLPDRSAYKESWRIVMDEQFRQFDNYRIGDCEGEVLYNDFCFAGARGLTLGEDSTVGPSGVSFGTAFDQNTVDVDVHHIAPAGFPIVNGQFCCVGDKDFAQSCYVHTAPEFTGTLSMIENDLFARPRQAMLLEGGLADVRLATVSGAGATAFVLRGGHLSAENVFLSKPSQIALADSASTVRIASAVLAKGVTGPPSLDEIDGALVAVSAHQSALGGFETLGGSRVSAVCSANVLSWRLPALEPGRYRIELLTGDSGGDGPAEFTILGVKRPVDVWPNDSLDYDLGTYAIAQGQQLTISSPGTADSRLAKASVRAVPLPPGIAAGDVAAWTILSETPIVRGLAPIMKTDEGLATPVVAGNRPALRVPSETLRARSGPFLYFNVEDPRLNSGQAAGEVVTLQIEYFDAGQGQIGVQYDAGDGNGFKSAPSTIALKDSQTWKTAAIALANPQFANRSNGHDFRITLPKENPPAIASVALVVSR